jgi:hypothetical protein
MVRSGATDGASESEDDVQVVLECKYCPEVFYDETDLEDHILVHLRQPDHNGLDGGAAASSSLFEAPRVIAKHTGGPRNKSIPPAPMRVAKRTGSVLRRLNARKRSTGSRSDVDDALADPRSPTEGHDQGRQLQYRRTRSQTGSIHGLPNYNEGEEDHLLNLPLDLPPPIPLPPEPGLVIYQGEWVTQQQAEKARNAKRKSNPNKVLGYNYKPTIFTITGKSKASTVDAAENEEDGEYPCPYEGCQQVYARERSLNSHVSRSHHTNLKAECPECGKGLSSPAAISKHLLSHRPREFWPYFCPLPDCGRKFQAKGRYADADF